MSRFVAVLCAILLVLSLAVGVSATSAQEISIFNTVSNDGSCQVNMTVKLTITESEESFTFPVPKDATNITLNGSRVGTEQTGAARLIDLSSILGGMTGTFSFTVNYTLTDLVQYASEEDLLLSLPLLAGFGYPVDRLQFSITLPSPLTAQPNFYSGYHQKNIEKDLTYSVSGANIAGRSWNALKDHETLLVTVPVTEEMFPQNKIDLPTLDDVGLFTNLCALLALIYWIFFLRNFPFRRVSQTTVPEGLGAGQMVSVLSVQGADLSLTVFSWAQLGYLTIRMDRRGHVYLHKRMEMGNERSAFEQRCFHNLFSRREQVDTGSTHYIRQCQAAGKLRGAWQGFVSRRGGSIKLFRGLISLCGAFSAASLAVVFSSSMALPWLLIVPVSILGLISAVHMLHWVEGLLLHRKGKLILALVLCVAWLVVGYLAGQIGVSVWMIVLMAVGGLLAFFGGRRSETGKQAVAEILSLRKHLRKLSAEQIHQLYRSNPEFYFDFAPYAMALGISRAFSRRFGKLRMPSCPYIQIADTHNLTARQWSQLFKQVMDGMNARQKQMPLEKMRKAVRSVRNLPR